MLRDIQMHVSFVLVTLKRIDFRQSLWKYIHLFWNWAIADDSWQITVGRRCLDVKPWSKKSVSCWHLTWWWSVISPITTLKGTTGVSLRNRENKCRYNSRNGILLIYLTASRMLLLSHCLEYSLKLVARVRHRTILRPWRREKRKPCLFRPPLMPLVTNVKKRVYY